GYYAAKRAPHVDVAVAICKFKDGKYHRGHSDIPKTGRVITLAEEDVAKCVPHELGHCLFGLGDEYGAYGAGDPSRFLIKISDSLAQFPNLTTDAAEGVRRWGVPSVIEGGMGSDHGVFHAYPYCRMREAGDPLAFCPACEAVIRGLPFPETIPKYPELKF